MAGVRAVSGSWLVLEEGVAFGTGSQYKDGVENVYCAQSQEEEKLRR